METERRHFPRINCTGRAQLQAWIDEEPCSGRILDLSAEGCLIALEFPQQIDLDTIVELTFEVDRSPFRVLGRVRSVRSDTALGLHFPALPPRARRRLGDLIQDMLDDRARHPSRRAPSASAPAALKNPRFNGTPTDLINRLPN